MGAIRGGGRTLDERLNLAGLILLIIYASPAIPVYSKPARIVEDENREWIVRCREENFDKRGG